MTRAADEDGPPVRTIGEAGASALRKGERLSRRHRTRVEQEVARDQEWRAKVREEHPLLGRLASAITPRPDTAVPQHVRAWATGADGEAKLGRRLDTWAQHAEGRFVLHDRLRPGSRASNIDHMVVTGSSVWVIDAKEYAGRVEHVNVGGLLFPDWRLKVGGRNRSTLAAAVAAQRDQVAQVIGEHLLGRDRPPVYGMLCFVEADWGLFTRPFAFAGIQVCWPAAAEKLISGDAPGPADRAKVVTQILAAAFPPA